ncbi:LAME_0F14862g1_1 [Lachancea meyersii CBS 8951]|uniref:LAME_0F14862g1_1 n=1 Tax=Lachancea meyersii CBS 8951 TaxID=1266667 RepID=A0A1G4JY81_9SACH|nr:LAME_0F14862g1_1 [Lachancea meyersii CBS 8951]
MSQTDFNGESRSQEANRASKLPLDKPCFKEAYETALKFYAKDDVLDTRDRLELSKAYVSISRAQLWSGWTAFALVFGTPFGIQLYKTRAIKGVKVPRNFVLGLLAMALTAHTSGKAMYKSQLSRLDPNSAFESSSEGNWDTLTDHDSEEISSQSGLSRERRQYDMLKLLGYGMAPKWGQYFYSTYTNPERRLPNPKVKLDEMKNGKTPSISPFLNQRDPIGLYSGPRHDKKDGIPQLAPRPDQSATISHDIDDDDPLGQVDTNPKTTYTSSWDRVRNQRGVTNDATGGRWSQIRTSPLDSQSQQAPPRNDKDENSDDFEALLEKERRGEDTI